MVNVCFEILFQKIFNNYNTDNQYTTNFNLKIK